jgi:predicted DsbA family dithiol-disulfide isomerase
LAARQITVFSDFACPFSYVTEASLRSAGDQGEIVYRAMELFPAPAPLDPPDPQVGGEAVKELAVAEGLELVIPSFRPRTRKAHEATRVARSLGLEPDFRRRVFEAFWTRSLDIGRIDVLTQLAQDAGIDPEDLKIALDIDRFEGEVVQDTELAHRLRVPGTPTLFVGTGREARIIAGAYGAADLRRWLEDE